MFIRLGKFGLPPVSFFNNIMCCGHIFGNSCLQLFVNFVLSYDVAVNRWITACHKNHMTTRVITLWRVDVTSLITSIYLCTLFFTKIRKCYIVLFQIYNMADPTQTVIRFNLLSET